MSIHLFVRLTARQDKLKAFAEILKQTKTALPDIEGCEGARIFRDMRDPCIFFLEETWASEEQPKFHLTESVRSGGWTYFSSHLISDPVIAYFDEM